jgi:hypothetical protein
MKSYALLALLLVIPAHAEWTQRDYASEYDGCLPACDKNNPREHDRCVSYCRCVTDGAQTRFSDHNQFVRDIIQRKLPDQVAPLQKIANRCNQQIWKNPARKLKFR